MHTNWLHPGNVSKITLNTLRALSMSASRRLVAKLIHAFRSLSSCFTASRNLTIFVELPRLSYLRTEVPCLQLFQLGLFFRLLLWD